MSLLFGTICAQREVFRLTTADDNNKALVLVGIKGGPSIVIPSRTATQRWLSV